MQPPTTPSPSSPPDEALSAAHADVDREEEELLRLRLVLPDWLRNNPGLSLTLLYLFASMIGVVFHYLLLKRFGFNVLEFSEASDFLMVVVREPLTVALALMGVPFYLGYGWVAVRFGRWTRRRSAWLRSTPEKRRATITRMRRWTILMQASFIGVYALVFVMVYSLWRASRIRAGDHRKVTVHFKTDSPRPGGALVAEGLALLGTTSRFVLLYNPATKQSEVAPLDAIANLVWDARSRREREADARSIQPKEEAPAPAPAEPAKPAEPPPSPSTPATPPADEKTPG